jgi:hypothetical protein
VAAGTSSGGGELLVAGASMIPWTNGQGEDVMMCARSRYGVGGQRGSAGAYDVAEIGDERPQVYGTPASNRR